MALGKTAAVTAGFIGAFGLGVWAGPHVTHRSAPPAAAMENGAAPTAAPVNADRPAAATPARARTVVPIRDRTAEFASRPVRVSLDAPELHQRLTPVLNKGANMDLAAEGFNSAEQFATVAHAARNTEVPFMLLKHRVLDEGDTLVAAIRKSKPDMDAVVEADRARAEARSDLSTLAKYESSN